MSETLLSDAALQSALAGLEVQRKVVADARLKSYALIGGGILVVAAGALLGSLIVIAALTGIALLITGGVSLYRSNQKFDDYKYGFKKNIVGGLLRSVDPNLIFDADSGLLETEFQQSQLFSQQPDRYSGQDEISGSAGKTAFKFSEVHAEYKTVIQTKNGRREVWHDIFRGLIFCADFNKNFSGLTVVRPKNMGNAVGAWIADKLPIFSSAGHQLVKLENPVFDKEFITYSNDQVEARYILTPAMMERICELNNSGSGTISLSFISSKVYIAFPSNKDYFEPPLFQSLLKTTSINEDLTVIKFMYGIIKELDLNTRIWGKG